ncbi:MAG TPA: BlaI/MecI/CopY family transcriptional regulator [Terriglobales bacterium]|nr:BlaI/MecI/CopY family transcriptional regulator [Terriglobales bacterium]
MNRIFSFFQTSPKTRLGPLEQELLEVLWKRKNATVRELLEDGSIQLAYTTVMTTLDRLYKKELLDRVAEGRAFRYSLRHSLQDLHRAAIGEVIADLLASGSSSTVPLSYLVEAISEHDARALDELQTLVERKRKELRDKE